MSADPEPTTTAFGMVHPLFSAKTVPEFIAHAKANPRQDQLWIGRQWRRGPKWPASCSVLWAGVDLIHVPYRGLAPALSTEPSILLSGARTSPI
jgi:hypothetical protein